MKTWNMLFSVWMGNDLIIFVIFVTNVSLQEARQEIHGSSLNYKFCVVILCNSTIER
jgi:hypothetical protein